MYFKRDPCPIAAAVGFITLILIKKTNFHFKNSFRPAEGRPLHRSLTSLEQLFTAHLGKL
uniref:Uncharacterized protein n=1 Tax=Meloidogyne incognita TaxID=6306 RepID=A0A914MR50_MELIC